MSNVFLKFNAVILHRPQIVTLLYEFSSNETTSNYMKCYIEDAVTLEKHTYALWYRKPDNTIKIVAARSRSQLYVCNMEQNIEELVNNEYRKHLEGILLEP